MDEPLYPLLRLCRLRMGTDGEGITTLIAGAGCPLSCRWCINRELLLHASAEFVTAAQLLERVRVDDLYFRATGGGVSFGGGEALLHAVFLRRFRELCPSSWRIRAETSLAVPGELLRIASDAVDDFIVDCKDLDSAIYRRYTGGDESLMESNLRILLREVGPGRIRVRVPYIPEYNTAEDQAHSAGKLRAMGITNIELFNYVVK